MKAEKQNTGFTGVWIPAEVWRIRGLSVTEKALYGFIHYLGGYDESGCWASNNYLANCLDSSPKSISNMLAKLQSVGLINKTQFDGRTRQIWLNLFKLPTPKANGGSIHQQVEGYPPTGGSRNAPHMYGKEESKKESLKERNYPPAVESQIPARDSSLHNDLRTPCSDEDGPPPDDDDDPEPCSGTPHSAAPPQIPVAPAKEKPITPQAALVNEYAAFYQEVLRVVYVDSKADYMQAARLLKIVSHEEIMAVAHGMLRCQDEWKRTRASSFKGLASGFNEFRAFLAKTGHNVVHPADKESDYEEHRTLAYDKETNSMRHSMRRRCRDCRGTGRKGGAVCLVCKGEKELSRWATEKESPKQ